VEILSADVAGSHGARPDVIIVNELHAITKQEFAENMADNADKVPWGLRVMATNAGFENTWQFRWRETSRLSPDEWFFHKWDKPAPWLSEKKIAAAKRRNSASRFNRLWYGVWAKGTGDALDEADIEACIVLDGPSDPEPGVWYLNGLDLGIKHDHASSVSLGVRPGSGRIVVARVRRWVPGPGGKVDLMEVERDLLADHERYNFLWCGYDPFQAELMAQRLTRAGVPMVEVPFVGKTLDLMARELMQAFRNRRVAMYDDPQFIADLFRLRITEKSYGYKLDSASDETGHADSAIAFSIVLPVALEASQLEPEPEDDADQGPTILVA
jgi:phage terminase large subunit-like protein